MNQMTPIQAHNLSDRAMLATLRITSWSARKYDRKVSDEVNASHGAAQDAGRYNKALLAKDALNELTSMASAARSFFYERTRPWFYDGTGILSVVGYEPFVDGMRGFRERHERAVAAFVAAYPTYVDDARHRLGEMFDPEDYPAPDEIAGKFAIEIRIMPVPDARDFRADISDEQTAMIRADIERANQEALAGAMRTTWQKVAEVVGRMSERLANYHPGSDGAPAKGVFRDSLVENVRELAGLLPALNLTDDPHLAAIAKRMERELCQVEPHELREAASERKIVQQRAAAILAEVEDYI